MNGFLRRFVDLETDAGGMGDPAGDPSAYTALEDPGVQPDPVAEQVPPQAEYLTRDQVEQILAERDAQLAYQLGGDPYQQVDPYQQQYEQPQPYQQQPAEYDPFSADSVRGLIRDEIIAAQQPLAQMLHPLAEQYQNQQAQQWADETFSRLGVPQDEPGKPSLRAAVLAASKAYEMDPWGRPVHPQIALQQAYQLMRPLVDAQREQGATAAEQQAQQQAEQRATQLRAVAGAPNVPNGPGGLAAEPQPANERDAFRAAFERVTAGGAGTAA